MKNVHSFMLPIAAVGVLMFPVVLNAASLEPIDSTGVQVQQQQQNGITYLSGGSERMRREPLNKRRATTCT